MSRLFLHIGSPKAGSSAIQAGLQGLASDPVAAAAGLQVLPPNPYGKPLPSGFVAARYLPLDDLPRYLQLRQQRDPEQFSRDLDDYQAVLTDRLMPLQDPRWRWQKAQRQAWNGTAVLSSEYLWRLPIEQIQALRKDFEALGVTEFRVMAYVREPVSAYGSFLQQWLRLSTDLERYNPLHWHYQPRQHLEAWAAVFGSDLVVRPFVREQLRERSVVSDCFAALGAWVGCALSVPELPVANEAFSTEELFLVQDLLRALPPDQWSDPQWPFRMARFRRLLRSAAQPLGCQPVRLQPWVACQVWQRHQHDLAWLKQQHGLTFPAPAAALSQALAPEQRGAFALEQLLCPPESSERTLALMRGQLVAVLAEGV